MLRPPPAITRLDYCTRGCAADARHAPALDPADLYAADAILAAAFGVASDWRGELQRYLTLQPDGWLLAELDGQPAAVGGGIDYGGFAYIGPLGVHPSAQRRGLARLIMERLLGWFDRRGCPLVGLDATEHGAPLYRTLGFEEVDRAWQFQRAPGSSSVSPTGPVSPLRLADLPDLVAFDWPRFGADRGAVFASFLADAPDRAFVARDDASRVTGFLFAQPRRLGPWVAASPKTAEALLARALDLPFDEPPLVIAMSPPRSCWRALASPCDGRYRTCAGSRRAPRRPGGGLRPGEFCARLRDTRRHSPAAHPPWPVLYLQPIREVGCRGSMAAWIGAMPRLRPPPRRKTIRHSGAWTTRGGRSCGPCSSATSRGRNPARRARTTGGSSTGSAGWPAPARRGAPGRARCSAPSPPRTTASGSGSRTGASKRGGRTCCGCTTTRAASTGRGRRPTGAS